MIASDLATTSMTTFSRFQVALKNCEQVKKKSRFKKLDKMKWPKYVRELVPVDP